MDMTIISLLKMMPKFILSHDLHELKAVFQLSQGRSCVSA